MIFVLGAVVWCGDWMLFRRSWCGFSIDSDSDCILHGYIKKLGGPFASAWQTRYARLYPNRLELHYESNSKPELVLMDHIEDINSELTTFKGEQSILLRTKEGTRVVLTNQVLYNQSVMHNYMLYIHQVMLQCIIFILFHYIPNVHLLHCIR